jgi:hypothetical protein
MTVVYSNVTSYVQVHAQYMTVLERGLPLQFTFITQIMLVNAMILSGGGIIFVYQLYSLRQYLA